MGDAYERTRKVPLENLSIEQLCLLLEQYPFREGTSEKRRSIQLELDRRIDWNL